MLLKQLEEINFGKFRLIDYAHESSWFHLFAAWNDHKIAIIGEKNMTSALSYRSESGFLKCLENLTPRQDRKLILRQL